jgi:hypothetical protein
MIYSHTVLFKTEQEKKNFKKNLPLVRERLVTNDELPQVSLEVTE